MSTLDELLSSYQYIRDPAAGVVQPSATDSGGGGMDAALMALMQGGGAPAMAGGGGGMPTNLQGVSLLWEDPGHYDHMHFGADKGNIVPLLRKIDRMPGFRVSENKFFDHVDPVHTENSQHYRNRKGRVRRNLQGRQAGDVNYTGGGRFATEAEALDWLERWLRKRI